MSPNILGALVMMASMACFTLNDTLIKLTDGDVPLFQLLVLRGALTIALICALAGRVWTIHFNIMRRDWMWIFLRSGAELVATYCFLTALFHMPLANVTAILQALPLTVTLASAVLLGERFGAQRGAMICLGFVGVMLIVRPGGDGFNVWSLYALGAVVCATARDVLTRQLSQAVPGMTVTLCTARCLGTHFV